MQEEEKQIFEHSDKNSGIKSQNNIDEMSENNKSKDFTTKNTFEPMSKEIIHNHYRKNSEIQVNKSCSRRDSKDSSLSKEERKPDKNVTRYILQKSNDANTLVIQNEDEDKIFSISKRMINTSNETPEKVLNYDPFANGEQKPSEIYRKASMDTNDQLNNNSENKNSKSVTSMNGFDKRPISAMSETSSVSLNTDSHNIRPKDKYGNQIVESFDYIDFTKNENANSIIEEETSQDLDPNNLGKNFVDYKTKFNYNLSKSDTHEEITSNDIQVRGLRKKSEDQKNELTNLPQRKGTDFKNARHMPSLILEEAEYEQDLQSPRSEDNTKLMSKNISEAKNKNSSLHTKITDEKINIFNFDKSRKTDSKINLNESSENQIDGTIIHETRYNNEQIKLKKKLQETSSLENQKVKVIQRKKSSITKPDESGINTKLLEEFSVIKSSNESQTKFNTESKNDTIINQKYNLAHSYSFSNSNKMSVSRLAMEDSEYKSRSSSKKKAKYNLNQKDELVHDTQEKTDSDQKLVSDNEQECFFEGDEYDDLDETNIHESYNNYAIQNLLDDYKEFSSPQRYFQYFNVDDVNIIIKIIYHEVKKVELLLKKLQNFLKDARNCLWSMKKTSVTKSKEKPELTEQDKAKFINDLKVACESHSITNLNKSKKTGRLSLLVKSFESNISKKTDLKAKSKIENSRSIKTPKNIGQKRIELIQKRHREIKNRSTFYDEKKYCNSSQMLPNNSAVFQERNRYNMSFNNLELSSSEKDYVLSKQLQQNDTDIFKNEILMQNNSSYNFNKNLETNSKNVPSLHESNYVFDSKTKNELQKIINKKMFVSERQKNPLELDENRGKLLTKSFVNTNYEPNSAKVNKNLSNSIIQTHNSMDLNFYRDTDRIKISPTKKMPAISVYENDTNLFKYNYREILKTEPAQYRPHSKTFDDKAYTTMNSYIEKSSSNSQQKYDTFKNQNMYYTEDNSNSIQKKNIYDQDDIKKKDSIHDEVMQSLNKDFDNALNLNKNTSLSIRDKLNEMMQINEKWTTGKSVCNDEPEIPSPKARKKDSSYRNRNYTSKNSSNVPPMKVCQPKTPSPEVSRSLNFTKNNVHFSVVNQSQNYKGLINTNLKELQPTLQEQLQNNFSHRNRVESPHEKNRLRNMYSSSSNNCMRELNPVIKHNLDKASIKSDAKKKKEVELRKIRYGGLASSKYGFDSTGKQMIIAIGQSVEF